MQVPVAEQDLQFATAQLMQVPATTINPSIQVLHTPLLHTLQFVSLHGTQYIPETSP